MSTVIPESSDTLLSVTGVGGRFYAVYSHLASHRVSIHAEDGTYLRERIVGTPADDTIYARDRRRDRVLCGGGADRVIADRIDIVSGCEIVRRR